MSDSDSETEQQFNLRKLPEQQQPHVKEILEKGRKILPSYDDESLYGLFKRYYCVENIFLNELHIIAKRAKGDNDDDRKKDQKWIKVGREIKTKVNKTKYNFLEDKQLLRRAEQFLKNKKLAPQRRENLSDRRDVEKKQDYRKRENVQQPQHYNRSAQNQRPKQKFVEKAEDVKKQTQPFVPEQKTETRKVESPVKEQKYKEKVVEPTQQVAQKPEHKPAVQPKPVEEKTQTHQKYEEKKSVNHEPVKEQPPKPQVHKKQEVHKKQQHPKEHVKSVHHPPKHEEKKTHENHHQKHPAKKETVSHHEKQQPPKESSSHSIPTVQNFDPVIAGENFKQACNQNSFVLKFIQPQAYPQRISYIRTADGGMKNVQIRVTGTSTQGSQKAL